MPPGYAANAASVASFAVVPLTIVPDPALQLAGIWPTCFDVVVSPFLKGTTFAVDPALDAGL